MKYTYLLFITAILAGCASTPPKPDFSVLEEPQCKQNTECDE